MTSIEIIEKHIEKQKTYCSNHWEWLFSDDDIEIGNEDVSITKGIIVELQQILKEIKEQKNEN